MIPSFAYLEWALQQRTGYSEWKAQRVPSAFICLGQPNIQKLQSQKAGFSILKFSLSPDSWKVDNLLSFNELRVNNEIIIHIAEHFGANTNT